jgi:hypothetical protein
MTDKEIIKALAIHTNGTYNCTGCPYMPDRDCSDKILTDSLNLINRQQAEIERLKDTKQIEVYERLEKEIRAEAIKDFADRFDDILAGMRDEYAHFGRPEYCLVCEVVHAKLSTCVKKVVGKKYEY